jgi:hypothetical protein
MSSSEPKTDFRRLPFRKIVPVSVEANFSWQMQNAHGHLQGHGERGVSFHLLE